MGEAARDWRGVTIAVVGGDRREQEIARRAAATGATVRAFGFPWPADGIAGVEPAPDAAAALRRARFGLFPIPGMASDGSLYAPALATPLVPDRALLSVMAPDAHLILGIADAGLRQAAAGLGIRIHEYEHDRDLMLLRAPAIIEGALAVAIQHTDITLHRARIGVVGQGSIGAHLTRTLVLLGAAVTAVARASVQRAAAQAVGAAAITLDALPMALPRFDVLFSTVPVRLIERALLARLPPHALVIDLAAPPGGVDLDAARALGLKAVWARGLGQRAPVTVGASQWQGIAARIAQILSG